MWGRFLEFSLAAPDIQASLDFYSKLGFSQTDVGDAWPHPYAVVSDGRVCLGLHQAAIVPSLTFVKPDLLKHLQPLENLGLDFEVRRLGEDVFNEVAWFDPSGQRIRLIEARTFSPSKRASTDMSRCGYFLEIALPARDLEQSKIYYEQFGFVGIDESHTRLPYISCTSDFIDLGLYGSAHLKRAALRFEVEDVSAALERLVDVGIAAAKPLASPLESVFAAMLVAPEGTPILISSSF